MICQRILVRGRVQGVGFRYSARAEALRVGVAGTARNRDDGAVDVVVEGDAAPVAAMLDWLAVGPPGARVESVEVSELTPTGLSGFMIVG
ncbi:acylphosphatase [Leifsonia sp. YAF41]|uniref:acylphosphatase n=1 Tax=Leifsonia sp. YAF41 TaxID=3233086 RepID=UPI003F9D1AF1